MNNINEVWPVQTQPRHQPVVPVQNPAALRRHDHSGDGGVQARKFNSGDRLPADSTATCSWPSPTANFVRRIVLQ